MSQETLSYAVAETALIMQEWYSELDREPPVGLSERRAVLNTLHDAMGQAIGARHHFLTVLAPGVIRAFEQLEGNAPEAHPFDYGFVYGAMERFLGLWMREYAEGRAMRERPLGAMDHGADPADWLVGCILKERNDTASAASAIEQARMALDSYTRYPQDADTRRKHRNALSAHLQDALIYLNGDSQ